jgi:hypothetical protein
VEYVVMMTAVSLSWPTFILKKVVFGSQRKRKGNQSIVVSTEMGKLQEQLAQRRGIIAKPPSLTSGDIF